MTGRQTASRTGVGTYFKNHVVLQTFSNGCRRTLIANEQLAPSNQPSNFKQVAGLSEGNGTNLSAEDFVLFRKADIPGLMAVHFPDLLPREAIVVVARRARKDHRERWDGKVDV